jgi:hypothetical protein
MLLAGGLLFRYRGATSTAAATSLAAPPARGCSAASRERRRSDRVFTAAFASRHIDLLALKIDTTPQKTFCNGCI